MRVYVDLLLIQDTIIMSILLLLLSKIIKIKIRMVRVLIISTLSSIISIFLLVYLPTLYDNLLIKFIISFFIVKLGFKLKETISTFQKVMLFWMITLLLGGIEIFAEGNSIQTLLIFGLMGISLASYLSKWKKQRLLESVTCFIEFDYDDRKYVLKALVDTGHDVKTVYGEDVIFIKENILKKGGDNKERIVSYKTISGMENKKGIKIDHIKVKYKEKNIDSNAVIVSTPNISKNYDAIVSLDLIEGGMTNGDSSSDERKGKKVVY